MDRQDWARLSPLLDEMLDASTRTRDARLHALDAEDVSAAEGLRKLLGGLEKVDAGFMNQPARLPCSGIEGQAVGAWRLVRQIGQGGMGTVWLARRDDGRFDGQAAIKFVNLASLSPSGIERFSREGRILARLSHPHIARLIDAGMDELRQPYLVLEYVDGLPIDRYCETHGLGIRERLALFADVLEAVAHAHTRLILHRDIKPGNILVDATGAVKLLDFGIARLLGPEDDARNTQEPTKAGAQMFTPAYAAPEQVLGLGSSTATDVYALGVLLHGLLGGGHPTSGATTGTGALDALRAVVETPPRKLSSAALANAPDAGEARARARRHARALRGDLDTIVSKALRKTPAERYANAAAFAADLQRHLRNEPVQARPETVGYLAAKFVRRHRLGVAAAALIALALAVAAVASAWMAHRMDQQRQRAETLVEFMIGDLRRKLQPVGRLDLLDDVGAEVLSYYDSPELTAQADAASLGRRARALHLIGEIRDKRGQLERARDAFQEAAGTTGALLARAPDDAQRVFDHAQSLFWVGSIDRRLGRVVEAARALDDYLALARRLVALDPARAEWQMELGYANEAVGVARLEAGRPDEALASFGAARDVQQRLEAAHPDLRIELARTFGWISEAQLARAELAAALQAQRDKLAVLDRIPRGTDDRIVQEQQAIGLSSVSMLERLLGHLGPALAAREDAVRRYEALVAIDATNTVWLANLCAVRIGLAELLADLGDGARAAGELRRADADLERSHAHAGGEAPRHLFIAGRSLLVHARLARDGALAPAIDDVRGYLERAGRFAAEGHKPDNEQAPLTLQLEQRLAAMLARAGRADEARAQWTRFVHEALAQPAGKTLPVKAALAQALRALHRRDEAQAVLEQLRAASCRPPELEAPGDA